MKTSLHFAKALFFLAAAALLSVNAKGQYCIPTPTIGCGSGEYASQFSMTGTSSSINDPSLSCPIGSYYGYGGYENRTSETCAVASPSIVNCTITSNLASTPGGWTYTPYSSYPYYTPAVNESVQLWVDWDNNFTFDATETIGGSVPLSGALDAFTVTIPSGVAAGFYRMRLVISSQASYPSMDPCMQIAYYYFPYSYTTGTSIDYTIQVGSATVCPAPVVTTSGITCTSANINWAAVSGATGYEYVVNSIATSPSGAGTPTGALTYAATGLTPATNYYAHVRTNCGTGFSAWTNVPFTTATSTVPAITGGTTVCAGSTLALSNSLAGGVWGSSNTTVATVNGSGVVTGVTPGSTSIVYYQGGCYNSLNITVTPGIGVISGSTTFCATGSTTLSNATPGGVWSSSTSSVATTSGTSTITGVSAGTATITYTAAGCSQTIGITVDPNNGGTVTGADSICKGSAHAMTLTASQTGGVWSSSNTTKATVDASGLVTGTGTSGSVVISYVVNNTCGTFTVTHTVGIRSASRCATGVPTMDNDVVRLKVFPNPSQGAFAVNLESDIQEDVLIMITNIKGEEITEFTTSSNKNVDVKLKTPPGIYTLSATTARGKYVAKIVIDK